MLETKKRINLWDNIKGILILLVVLGHCLWEFSDCSLIADILKYIYIFHMPVFVFVSGYFGTKKPTSLSIAKLFFAYYIFNSVTGVLYGYTNILIPLYSYWYILALILWRLTADKVEKVKNSLFVTIVIGLLIGFIPEIDNTMAFARFIAFYPFYLAGYKFANLQMSQNEKEIQLVTKIIDRKNGLIAAFLAIVFSYTTVNFFPIQLDNLVMYSYTGTMDFVIRFFIYVVSSLCIFAFIGLTPKSEVPFITEIGRNSISVFLVQRVLTLTFTNFVRNQNVGVKLLSAVFTTFIICIVFGNDLIGQKINHYLEMGGEILLDCKHFFEKNIKYQLTSISAIIVFVCLLFNALLPTIFNSVNDNGDVTEEEIPHLVVPRVLTDENEERFMNAYRVVFSGDLLLLEDQVKRGLQEDGTYSFDDVFEYAKPYIETADFSIGVFEGPMAGESKVFSEGNFDDGKELYLNFPKEYGEAVYNAGFDLVTTAGNHLLDRGLDGMLTTLENLGDIGINSVGSYSSFEDKEKRNVYYVEQNGISFAVLAYTYGINYHDTEELYRSDLSYCTSFIYGVEGDFFEELKKNVEKDFEKAKSLEADFIIVLPHYGTQFLNVPDEMQLVWNSIFKENGADIILGDHAHAIEPVDIEIGDDGHKTFEAFCPGNFANIYREKQGDTSALIEVYIDRDTKEIIGGGVVPLYTQAPIYGNYRAIPIYDVIHNEDLRKSITTDDYDRAMVANSIISSVAFNEVINIQDVQKTYLFDEDGYLRPIAKGLIMTDDMMSGILWPLIEESNSICFLGDSITEGTANCGCPWYEPILEYIPEKNIANFSKGGCTIEYLLNNTDIIPASDLYVIAIGTNDVRHFDRSDAASTPEEYIKRIDELSLKLMEKNSSAKLVFIAPWYSTDGDPATILTYTEKLQMNDAYCVALENYCQKNNYSYININEDLRNILDNRICSYYMVDHIHPNATNGVLLYSELVLNYKK